MRTSSLDDIKAIPILDVAQALGLSINRTSIRCPFAGHEERNPSFSFYPADGRCWCHRCGKGGDTINLVAFTQDVSKGEAIAWLRAQFGLGGQGPPSPLPLRLARPVPKVPKAAISSAKPKSEVYAALLDLCPLNAAALDFLTGRGFTAKTIQHFKLGALTDNRVTTRALIARFGRPALVEAGLLSAMAGGICFVAPAILFPFYVRGELIYLQARALPGGADAKWLGLKGAPKPVFNFDVISKARSVYICEGATDVLSVHQMGRAAIGVLGGMTALPNEVVESLSGKDVYIVPDRDAVGETMLQRLKAQLQRAGVSAITKRLDVGGDVNERLMMRVPR
ncbi:MAG TPA: toprim domain-containing protein [Caulobacteraceae bacterium]|nr:toprim domain-containing protein [Caulobacteraceae bacterium]